MRHHECATHESYVRGLLSNLDEMLRVHQGLAEADRAMIGEDGVQVANHIPFAANLIGD